MTVSSDQFRRVLGRFATGICVVTIPPADKAPALGLTVNSFASVSLEPPLVLWCLDKLSDRYEPFAKADAFAVSILASGQDAVSNHFAENAEAGDHALATWQTGAPVLSDTLAGIDCTVSARHDAGDHIIVVGAVQRLEVLKEGAPLVYYKGRYGGLAD